MIYVLHAFQKKSPKGIATPRHAVQVIKDRYRRAQAHHAEHYGEEG